MSSYRGILDKSGRSYILHVVPLLHVCWSCAFPTLTLRAGADIFEPRSCGTSCGTSLFAACGAVTWNESPTPYKPCGPRNGSSNILTSSLGQAVIVASMTDAFSSSRTGLINEMWKNREIAQLHPIAPLNQLRSARRMSNWMTACKH